MIAIFRSALRLLTIAATSIIAFHTLAAAEETSIHQLLSDFGNRLYVLGETTGGSEAEWAEAEQKAVAELGAIAAKSQETLVAIDETGMTPLIAASSKGYAFLVKQLLGYSSVVETIDTQDSFGLTAFDHSQLAIKQTKPACIPDLRKNVWASIPFMVTQPYYGSRSPYEKISHLLIRQGSKRNEDRSKTFWLEHCKGATTAARETVAQSANLQADLFALTRAGKIDLMASDRSKLEHMIIGMGEQGNLSPDKVNECLAEIRTQVAPSQHLSCLF